MSTFRDAASLDSAVGNTHDVSTSPGTNVLDKGAGSASGAALRVPLVQYQGADGSPMDRPSALHGSASESADLAMSEFQDSTAFWEYSKRHSKKSGNATPTAVDGEDVDLQDGKGGVRVHPGTLEPLWGPGGAEYLDPFDPRIKKFELNGHVLGYAPGGMTHREQAEHVENLYWPSNRQCSILLDEDSITAQGLIEAIVQCTYKVHGVRDGTTDGHSSKAKSALRPFKTVVVEKFLASLDPLPEDESGSVDKAAYRMTCLEVESLLKMNAPDGKIRCPYWAMCACCEMIAAWHHQAGVEYAMEYQNLVEEAAFHHGKKANWIKSYARKPNQRYNALFVERNPFLERAPQGRCHSVEVSMRPQFRRQGKTVRSIQTDVRFPWLSRKQIDVYAQLHALMIWLEDEEGDHTSYVDTGLGYNDKVVVTLSPKRKAENISYQELKTHRDKVTADPVALSPGWRTKRGLAPNEIEGMNYLTAHTPPEDERWYEQVKNPGLDYEGDEELSMAEYLTPVAANAAFVDSVSADPEDVALRGWHATLAGQAVRKPGVREKAKDCRSRPRMHSVGGRRTRKSSTAPRNPGESPRA